MGGECRDTLLVGSSPTPTAKIYTYMSKFECSLCGKHVELTKHVIKVVDGSVVMSIWKVSKKTKDLVAL